MENKLPKLADLVRLARRWGLRGLGRLRKNEIGKTLSRALPERSMRELLQLGKNFGLKGLSKLKKSELVERLGKALERLSPAGGWRGVVGAVGAAVFGGASNRAATVAPPRKARKRANMGGKLELVAREPNWLYAWWELDRETTRKLGKPGVVPVLRVMAVEEDGSERQVAWVDLPLHARSWHLRVDQAGMRYRARLEIRQTGGGSETVLVSPLVVTPQDTPSGRLATMAADAKGKRVRLPAAAAAAAAELNRLSEAPATGPLGASQVSSLPSSR